MFRSIFKRFAALSLLSAMFVTLGFADTIKLKDGSLFKGTIVSFSNGKFVIVMGSGSRRKEMTVRADEIESIRFEDDSDSPARDTPVSSQPAKTPSPRVVTTDNTKPVLKDPDPTQRPVAKPKTTPITTTPTPSTTAQTSTTPVSWSVKVLADNTANGWTNTGFVVKKGQRIRITADGTVSLGNGKTSSPSGESDIDDPNKLLKAVATGAVIAVIGDDNNDFIYVGAEREFTASRDGALFLGINEGNLDDNSGAFSAKIEIFPLTGSE
jgi:hypothetical protein